MGFLWSAYIGVKMATFSVTNLPFLGNVHIFSEKIFFGISYFRFRLGSLFSTMSLLPTREIDMAPGDIDDLLAFTPSKPEETSRFAELDFKSILSIFESEKDTLEGILKYEMDKGCCYVLAFHELFDQSLLDSRLGLYPTGEIPLTRMIEDKKETVFYQMRRIALARFEKTNKELYNFLYTNLIEAVTTGKRH